MCLRNEISQVSDNVVSSSIIVLFGEKIWSEV